MTIKSLKPAALAAIAVFLGAGTSAALVASADAQPSHGTVHAARHHHRRHHHRHSHIPQHNGGDHDSDNNGGPSDGDGNI
jgi:hypothetical protein